MGSPIIPYKDNQTGKKQQVAAMFDRIAGRYDFLNGLFSFGIDQRWRKVAVSRLKALNPQSLLDVATGTGKFAIMAAALEPRQIIGVDISNEMMNVGRARIQAKNLDHLIELKYGDSENLPFKDNTFDAITVGFGVRNFENLELGLKEMHRVLKEDGAAVVLEFSKPNRFPMKQLYGLYFKYIIPFLGALLSKDRRAYSYLPESVQVFPEGEEMSKLLQKAGYRNAEYIPLTFGICTLYFARK